MISNNFDLKSKKGFIFLNNIPITIYPIEAIFILFNDIIKINKLNKLKANQFLEEIIKNEVKIILDNKFRNKSNKIIRIKEIINYINLLGLGEIELININHKKENQKEELRIIIKSKYNHLNQHYFKLFNQNSIIDYDNLKNIYLKLFLEEIFKTKINIKKKETKFNVNEEYFEIRINKTDYLNRNNNKKTKNIKILIDKNNLNKYDYLKYIEIKNGSLKLWNAKGIFISQYFLISLLIKLNKLKEENIFIELGKIQGKFAYEMKRIKFGLSNENENKFIKNILFNSTILGYGKSTLINKNNNFEIKIKPFIKEIKIIGIEKKELKKIKEIFDLYFKNMILIILKQIGSKDRNFNSKHKFKIKYIPRNYNKDIIKETKKILELKEEKIKYLKSIPLNNRINI